MTIPRRKPEATSQGAEIGASTASIAAVNTDSVATLSNEKTVISDPTPDSVTPTHHHCGVGSLALRNALSPIDDGSHVPQSSPARAQAVAPSPPAKPSKTDNAFTTEEAHDVVIDIFKELAALSERVQARNAATKKHNLPSRSSHIPPPVAANPVDTDTTQAVRQPESFKVSQPYSAATPKGSRSVFKDDASASKENVLPPHLRLKKQYEEAYSKGLPTHNSSLPPPLRSLKQQIWRSPAINVSANYYATLDSDHQSSFLQNINQPDAKAVPHLHAVAGKRPHNRSIKSSSRVNGNDNEAVLKTSPALHCVPFNVIASEQQGKKEKTLQSSPRIPSKSSEANGLHHHNGASPLPISLVPSFLDKWGSKSHTLPPKASVSSGKPPEDLENQLVFKAWPGQVMRSSLGNALPSFPSLYSIY